MTILYISGPMTGYPEYNFPAFMAAEAKLRNLGDEVINPAQIEHRNKDNWVSCMRQAITEMLKADALVLLPGWEKSRGAQTEVELASRLEMAIEEYEYLLGRTDC